VPDGWQDQPQTFPDRVGTAAPESKEIKSQQVQLETDYIESVV
jgi:hypothetical protein